MKTRLTIGQLADRVEMPTSTLRFYEKEGLLTPAERSDVGYRLYDPAQEDRLRFIQRAQRLGFSLADIRRFLSGIEQGTLPQAALIEAAERRFFALERQLTELMVVRHELGLFLQDLYQRVEQDAEKTAVTLFTTLIDRVCHAPHLSTPDNMLDLLLKNTGCHLTSREGQTLLEPLRDRHIHVWQEGNAYKILVISQETAVADALQAIANFEADCAVHDDFAPAPDLKQTDEGYLLTCRGDNAYLFARLFLSFSS